MEFEEIHSRQSYGSYGIKILVAVKHELTADDISVANKAGDMVYNQLLKSFVLQDKDSIAAGKEMRTNILACFGKMPIFTEEIPNEYCGEPECIYNPWFLVATAIGHIKIGWRKRVIVIDWSKTNVKEKANKLFPNEDVTKGEFFIHAWSYEKAKQYIEKLHEKSNPLPTASH